MPKATAAKSRSKAKSAPRRTKAPARKTTKKPARKPAGKRPTKWVYSFGAGKAQGRADMRELLGGKGANLAEMASIGLPVPPGFTVTTEVCTVFDETGGKYPDGVDKQVETALRQVEKIVGARFGDRKNPLLVSVRSGARASIPRRRASARKVSGSNQSLDRWVAKCSCSSAILRSSVS